MTAADEIVGRSTGAAIVRMLVPLSPSARAYALMALQDNGVFCTACGHGTEANPNPNLNCDCENDE